MTCSVNGLLRFIWFLSRCRYFWKILSVEELQTLNSGHEAKDITPSMAWRREAWKEDRSTRRSSLKGKQSAAANQTNIGTVPKATFGETSERRGGAHVGFTERTLN